MELMPLCVNDTTRHTKHKQDLALAEYSPKDSKWDTQRAITQSMSDFLYQVQRFERWAERMDGCTRTLGFGEVVNPETGEIKPKLVDTFLSLSALSNVRREAITGENGTI